MPVGKAGPLRRSDRTARAFQFSRPRVEAGMAFCFDIPVRVALVVLGILVLVAFAPSNASAHGSHGHRPDVTHVDAPTAPDATSSTQKRVVEVSAAQQVPLAADHIGHPDCGDRGCCANGHCGSFHGVITPSLFAVFGITAASLERVRNASPPLGLAADGPARPPKSFA